MAKKRPTKSEIKFSFKFYFYLIRLSLVRPKTYSEIITKNLSLKQSLIFFTSSYILGSILKILIVTLISHQIVLLFLGLTELVFTLPLILLLQLVIGGIFYSLAKIFGGQANLRQTLAAYFFSFPLIILPSLPILNIFVLIFSLFLLVLNFQRIQRYSTLSALLTITLPILILILALLVTGVINISPTDFLHNFAMIDSK